jgi:PleD family two-component response regulator
MGLSTQSLLALKLFFNKSDSLVKKCRFDKIMRARRRKEALLALSLIDELTGLYNRRSFFVLTEQYIKLSVRSTSYYE